MSAVRARHARWLVALLVPMLAFVASLAALEAVLRTTHWLGARISWSQPDSVLGWRFMPDIDYWYDSRENDHPIVGRTNAWGWNDRQWALHKRPGTIRVAVLGDSYVEALQVEQDRNFLAIAENRLNADTGRHFELMNFARSGFTQTEEWLVLKDEIVRFDPDLVVLFYYAPNDIADVDPRTATDRLRPFPLRVNDDEVVMDTSFRDQRAFRLKSLMSPIKHRSALASLVAERITLLQAAAAGGRTPPPAPSGESGLGGYLSLATDSPSPLYARNYEVTKALVRAMIRFCAQRDVGFLLVVIDTPDYVPDVERRLETADPSFRFGFFDDDLARFARDQGARYLGLTAAFRARYAENGEALHFSTGRTQIALPPGNLGHPGHWNYAGHRYVAELLRTRLQAMTIWPHKAEAATGNHP